MIAIVRAAGLFASAIAVEMTDVAGILAFIAAAIIGLRRMRLSWIVLPALAGAVAAAGLPAGWPSGKVAHALTNASFLGLVYIAICIAGYFAGRLLRRAI